jgi:hypothetical protein
MYGIYDCLLSYDRLKDITKTQKPYRGTANKYPIDKRTASYKYFTVEKEGDDEVYHISYYEVHDHVEVTKEEYVDLNNKGIKTSSYTPYQETVARYFRVNSKPNLLGIVRPDDTFEYVKSHDNPDHHTSYNQGENILLSTWLDCDQRRSGSQGGTVVGRFKPTSSYSTPMPEKYEVFHPVFRGLRINLNDFSIHPSCHYKTTSKKVNRKAGKELLKGYETFYKVCETMLTPMEYKTFIDVAVDVIKESDLSQESLSSYYTSAEDTKLLAESADRIKDEAPLDAFIMYSVAYDINGMWQRVRNVGKNNYWTSNGAEMFLPKLFASVKRVMNKQFYKKNPSVLTEVDNEMGKYYPPCAWGVDLFVNGVETNQYF